MRKPLAAALMILAGALALTAASLPRRAIELNFTTHDGAKISLQALKGKVVAVMFFSTDCPHCQNTADLLGPIYKEYKPKGVEILALAVNPSAAANLKKFVAEHNVEFPTGLGTSQQWYAFSQMPFGKNAYVPHILFVDKDGNVVEDHPGEDRRFWLQQEKNIRAAFDRLLGQ